MRKPCADSFDPAAAPAEPAWMAHKRARGLSKLIMSARASWAGLKDGWGELAFRLELVTALILTPLAFWLGQSWVEVSLLLGSMLAVLVVELLNTGLESVVDRVGLQPHPLSRRAKDLGSAAVLLSLLGCLGIWMAALWGRLA